MPRRAEGEAGTREGARLPAAARALLEELLPGGVAWATPTCTRVDAGGWLGKWRVFAARGAGAGGGEDELVLFAAGPRPHVERIPLGRLGSSFYNHVTAEVALAPAEGASVRTLRLPPLEGTRLLSRILGEGRPDA